MFPVLTSILNPEPITEPAGEPPMVILLDPGVTFPLANPVSLLLKVFQSVEER